MSLKLIQQGLQGLRYDVGPADDRWGPRTEKAMHACIANRGEAVTFAAEPVAFAPGTPRLYQGSARYLVDEIVVHCADTRPEWMASAGLGAQVAEIRRWHMTDQDKRWKDIGYQWIVGRDGSVLAGRAETAIGAGVKDHNRGVVHICLIGGYGSASTDQFNEHFTPAQDARLRRLIGEIGTRTTIRRVSGHNEWAAKACPGFNVPAWLNAA